MHFQKPSTLKASSRLHKIGQFFLERIPAYRHTPHFEQWLEWADGHGFLLTVFPDEREETVLAAAIIRPITVQQLTAKYDSFAFNDKGAVLFLDNCVAPNTNLKRALLIGALQRFGPRLAFAYDTHKVGIRVRHFNRVRQALLK